MVQSQAHRKRVYAVGIKYGHISSMVTGNPRKFGRMSTAPNRRLEKFAYKESKNFHNN